MPFGLFDMGEPGDGTLPNIDKAYAKLPKNLEELDVEAMQVGMRLAVAAFKDMCQATEMACISPEAKAVVRHIAESLDTFPIIGED